MSIESELFYLDDLSLTTANAAVEDDNGLRNEIRAHLGRFLYDPAAVEAMVDGWIPFFSRETDWQAREDRIAQDFGTAKVRNDIRTMLQQFGVVNPEPLIGSVVDNTGWVPFFSQESDYDARYARVAQDYGIPQDAGSTDLSSLDYVPQLRRNIPSALDILPTFAPSDSPTIVSPARGIVPTKTSKSAGIPTLAIVGLAAVALYLLLD